MFFIRFCARGAVLALAGSAGVAGLLASPLDETINTLQQWVETERQISSTRAAWEQEKVSMQDLIALYREESRQLDQVIAEAAEAVSVAETRRAELLAREDNLKVMEARVLAALIDTEKRLKALEVRLPEPIREELRPLFRAIPDRPAESRLAIGQRIQPIVGVLTQIQRFNQAVTITEGFREFEAGKTVQTEKVFFGLGTAFYVDGANEHAGVGVFSPDGWQWRDDDNLAPLVREFVDIYRGNKQAKYITLPVQVAR